MTTIIEKIESLLVAMNAHTDVYCAELSASGKYDSSFIEYTKTEYTYTVDELRKYFKIVGHGSVVAFVDKVTGDIYKPASWKVPAKGIRGNVNSAENGKEAFRFYPNSAIVSVFYLRGGF